MPLVTAKHSLRATEDVWIVPHAINVSRPALHAALTGDSSVHSTVAELLAASEDATCAAACLSTQTLLSMVCVSECFDAICSLQLCISGLKQHVHVVTDWLLCQRALHVVCAVAARN